jgi:beta-glucosidase
VVGFAHNAPFIVPCNPGRKRDRIAARLRDIAWNRAFLHLIGNGRRLSRHTAANLDFLGLNYYTRTAVRSSGWSIGALLGRTCELPHHPGQGPVSATGWEVYPAGLKAVLEKFSRLGLPLFVTENGIATDDEPLRREFLMKHLENLAAALKEQVNVIGYLYWSLIDNFEWALGTKPRFGLAEVDYKTQQRLPRPYVEDFRQVCRENQLSLASKDNFACVP